MRHKLLTQVCHFVLESMEQKGMLSQHSVTRVIPPLASMVMANKHEDDVPEISHPSQKSGDTVVPKRHQCTSNVC